MPETPKPDPDKPPIEKKIEKTPLVSVARYSEMGFIIPSAILLGFFLGKLADYWLHTKWLYLVGLLFGAVVGFWQMIRMAVGAYKNDK
jgi:F0F1-type ATP synthase assembly protein I